MSCFYETGDRSRNDAALTQLVSQQVTDVWKAIKTAKILIPDYLVRVESCSTRFSATALEN